MIVKTITGETTHACKKIRPSPTEYLSKRDGQNFDKNFYMNIYYVTAEAWRGRSNEVMGIVRPAHANNYHCIFSIYNFRVAGEEMVLPPMTLLPTPPSYMEAIK